MVLITRPEVESRELATQLEHAQIPCAIFPTLEIQALHPQNHTQYQVIVFISKNAVKYGAFVLKNQKDYLLLAVGKATADALSDKGYQVDYYPEENPSSQALLALPEVKQLTGKKCLIVRGVGGVENLKQGLEAHKNTVAYLEVYQRVTHQNITPFLPNLELFMQHNNKIIVITSVDIFLSLQELLQERYVLDDSIAFVVASKRIAEYLQSCGLSRIYIASVRTADIIKGVKQWLN